MAGRGVLVFEDIASARQGDVLQGCTEQQAESVVTVLARLHAATWSPRDDAFPADLPRWRAQPMEPDRWADRVARASVRFPKILTRALAERLHDLPDRVGLALGQLRAGPVSWAQVDAHLDNVLWRADGTAVLLDWCNAAIAPPAIDLARFLSEGIAPDWRPALVAAYVRELGPGKAEQAEIGAGIELAVLPLLQEAVGWAGREDFVAEGRPASVCESWLRSVCAWALCRRTCHLGRREHRA